MGYTNSLFVYRKLRKFTPFLGLPTPFCNKVFDGEAKCKVDRKIEVKRVFEQGTN